MEEDGSTGDGKTGGRRFRPLMLVTAFVLILGLLALALPPQARSPRAAAVERLMQAAKAKDQAALAALVTPNASLWPLFDVVNRLNAPSLSELIGNCRPVRAAEGLDTVSVQFDCARDANGQFYVDFTFCRDKVHRVRFAEFGRWLRSPLGDDLSGRLLGLVHEDEGPCGSSPLDLPLIPATG